MHKFLLNKRQQLMKQLFFSVVAISAICNANAQKVKTNPVKPAAPALKVSPATKTPTLKNAVDSFSYAIGMSIGGSLKESGTTKLNIELIAKGMDQVFNNAKTVFDKEKAGMIIQQELQVLNKKKVEVQKALCNNFLEENKKRATVITLPSGLQYEIIKAGEAGGTSPKLVDTVIVNYAGTLMDGTEFDNSYKRGGPATFGVTQVIRGWTEILQLMTKGAKWKVYIPSELAYADNPPSAQIPPNSLLIFEMTLEDIKPAITAAQ